MFPYFTRILSLLAQPLTVAFVALSLAFVLGFTRWRRTARSLAGLGLLLLFVCCFTTFGYLLSTPLENRFPRPAEPARIDGIVVLGGGMNSTVNTARGGWELGRSGDRFVETLRLALRHPEARIIIAAGPAVLVQGQEPEALAAQRFFTAFGIPANRLLIDDKSRNTEENARFAKALASGTAGETWLLVTSAYHMPRSVGLFRKAGFDIVPWPTDYLTSGAEGLRIKLDQGPENLVVTTIAIREWAALAAYYLTGRIAELLPSP